MGETKTDRGRILDRVADSVQGNIQDEITSIALDRMPSLGGITGRIVRARALYSAISGPVGMALDIIDMAAAGYSAMTTERRIMARVAASHAFGYWCFQHERPHRPVNPPNAFLVMHRERDASDAEVGEEIGREDYSTDSRRTSRDWNNLWREAALGRLDSLDSNLRTMFRRGILERELSGAIGPVVHGQTFEVSANQYRAVFLASKYRSASVAAHCHLLCSLDGAAEVEIEPTIRFYQQFPYRP